MPVCEKCQTPYNDWQDFCLHCGTYLKPEPPPLLRCPKCGTGLETGSAFDDVLAPPVPKAPDYLAMVKTWKWLSGVAAALLVVAVFYIWHFHRVSVQVGEKLVSSPETAQRAAAEGGTEVKGAPPAEEARLQAEVSGLLNKIREANLKKDVLLFMETLSGGYPNLDQKREEVIRTWKKFSFKGMTYSIGDVQEVEPNKAVAEVNWKTTGYNLATKNWRTMDFQYRVWLANELGQWKITKIEQIPQ